VNDVSGAEKQLHRFAHRHSQLVGGDGSGYAALPVGHLPPVLVSGDIHREPVGTPRVAVLVPDRHDVGDQRGQGDEWERHATAPEEELLVRWTIARTQEGEEDQRRHQDRHDRGSQVHHGSEPMDRVGHRACRLKSRLRTGAARQHQGGPERPPAQITDHWQLSWTALLEEST
jgi:hypothetical protein